MPATEPYWLPIPSQAAKLFGIWLTCTTAALLVGWYAFDWDFVDPFFTTLLFVGAPFFYLMGMAMAAAEPKRTDFPDMPLPTA